MRIKPIKHKKCKKRPINGLLQFEQWLKSRQLYLDNLNTITSIEKLAKLIAQTKLRCYERFFDNIPK